MSDRDVLPTLIGAAAGRSIADTVFSRPVMLMLVWMILPKIASEVTYLWVPSKAAGLAAALGTMAAMAAFALMPRPSPARIALLEGMFLWAALILLIAVVRVFFAVIALGFLAGVTRELRWISYAVGAVALSALARWRMDTNGGESDIV